LWIREISGRITDDAPSQDEEAEELEKG